MARRAHDRLARADLSLQQPMHRMGAAQLLLQGRAHISLRTGQLERQLVVEPGLEPVATNGPGHGGQRRREMAPLSEDGLQHERLVEPQPGPGRPPLLGAVRLVHRSQRLRVPHQAMLSAYVVRQWISRRIEYVEDSADGVHQRLRGDLCRGWVDGPPALHVVGLELLQVRAAPEDVDVGMRELAAIAEHLHLAAEERDRPRLELALAPGLSEEREQQPVTSVGDHHLRAVGAPIGPPVAVLVLSDRLGSGQHGRVLADPDAAEVGQLAAVVEPPGIVGEEVLDGLEVECAA
jgi:hypothetical protein